MDSFQYMANFAILLPDQGPKGDNISQIDHIIAVQILFLDLLPVAGGAGFVEVVVD
ncbi:MAG: hypothetical protein LBB91_03635 [Clostridiales bacterium]|jgi:hypothetical protein|nr:hypothetical protein [Clostridiales bacterium]